jgi:hypothetical protein
MTRKSNKISTRWIRETRNDFRAFLDETDFLILSALENVAPFSSIQNG